MHLNYRHFNYGFFEKLMVVLLVMKFPALMKPELLLQCSKAPPLVRILSQINPIHVP
jgi:hypothetical protein